MVRSVGHPGTLEARRGLCQQRSLVDAMNSTLYVPSHRLRNLYATTAVILDWVLSHWVRFTVHSLDLFVFICVYFVLSFFILHVCSVIVSTVGWT